MVMMVVVVMVVVRPDDRDDNPMMVVVMVVVPPARSVAIVDVVVVITRYLHVAGLPVDRLALRLARRCRIGRPQRRDGVRNRIEQLGI